MEGVSSILDNVIYLYIQTTEIPHKKNKVHGVKIKIRFYLK